jgi:hypothetical protein
MQPTESWLRRCSAHCDERLRRALQRVADTPSGAAAERRVKLELATTTDPRRRYLILDSEEISRLHDQFAGVINRPPPWARSAHEAAARQCLLDVLASAQEKAGGLRAASLDPAIGFMFDRKALMPRANISRS